MIWKSILNIVSSAVSIFKPSQKGIERRDIKKRFQFKLKWFKSEDSEGGKEITPNERKELNEEIQEL